MEGLDDYNVEPFCDLLDEMTRSTDTRFVISRTTRSPWRA